MRRTGGRRGPKGWQVLAAVLLVGAAAVRLTGGDERTPGPAPGVEEAVPGPATGVEETAPGPAPGVEEAVPGPATGVEETAPGPATGVEETAPGPATGVEETVPGRASDAEETAPGAESGTEMTTPGPTPDAGETVVVADRLPATVVRVVDGDTLVVQLEDREERVRLIGVDTPEVHGGVERYGAEASAFAKERLTGAAVSLELDVGERDRYGRLLAYVWLGDEMFNETLVWEGYAQVMTVPPNVKYADRFVALEREARAAGRGLWGEGAAGGEE